MMSPRALRACRRLNTHQKRFLGTGETTANPYSVCFGNPTLGWTLTFDRSWQYRMVTMFMIGLIGNGLELMYEQHPPPGFSKLPYMKVRRREYWWGACEMFDAYCHAGWDWEELAHAVTLVLFALLLPDCEH